LTLDELQKLVKLAATINHSLQAFHGPEAAGLKKAAMKQTKKALKELQKALKTGLENEGSRQEVYWMGDATCKRWKECKTFEPYPEEDEDENVIPSARSHGRDEEKAEQ
jgi:hypothetical protein